MKQRKDVFECGHLLQVGVSSFGPNTVVIDAICVQSSHPDEKPHHIHVRKHLIDDTWKFDCSCKAGLGHSCKHIVAVLYYIEKLNTNKCIQHFSTNFLILIKVQTNSNFNMHTVATKVG